MSARPLLRIRDRDSGQALVMVMFIGVLTMLMLGTASTALISQIRPSANSVDSGAAVAAAEAGVDDFVAKVNAHCPPTDGYYCGWLTTGLASKTGITDPANQVGTNLVGADGSTSRQSYYWKVIYAVSGFARVSSTGQVPTGKASPAYRTKTLVADINATPSFNNFQYYTKYETYAPDFVDSFYAPRQIQITSSGSASGSSLSGPGTLSWNGVCSYVDATTTPNCDPSHSSDVCSDLYYPNDGGPGRSSDTGWNSAVRRPSSTTQSAMGTDQTFAYYSENGTFHPASGSDVAETHNDTCDSSFEPNMVMNGPVFSEDAYLIDRAKDTGNSKNSMPIFNDYAYSMWNGVSNGAQQAPGVNGGYDRAYPSTDGQISTAQNPMPIYTTNKLSLPPNGSAAKSLATCTYTGPTRVLIKQNIAYVTSPGTSTNPAPAGPSFCYASTGAFANATGGGVVDAQVPISSTLIYVLNPTSGSPTVATRSNPVFNLAATSPFPGPVVTNGLAGTWDASAYSSTAVCPSPANPLLRRSFDCETGTSTPREDMYAKIMAAVNSQLGLYTTLPTASVLQAALVAAINAQINTTALLPTNASYYYAPTVTVQLPKTVHTGPASLTPADPFLQQQSGGGFDTTTLGASVTLNRYACTAVVAGLCTAHSAPTAIVSGSVSLALSLGTAATATASFPWFGAQTGAHVYTDPNNDVTQYDNGYGDVYVEGQLKGSMSIVAEHDILLTNDVTYSNNTLATTTDGLALVADHNVRIYRPMTCSDDGTAGQTSPGYCPDDLTGVFTSPLSWPLPSNFPSNRYVPDNAPSMASDGSGQIYATIFTLRGSFMVDNFYRGNIGVPANVSGGLYQYHRGATSMPYQGRPYQGSTTKMPGMTLSYTYDNMRAGQAQNGGLRVPWIPTPSNRPIGSGRTWNVVSFSTGG